MYWLPLSSWGRRAALEGDPQSAHSPYGKEMSGAEDIARTIARQFTTRLRDSVQEEMWIAFLDVRNQFRGKTRVYIGCCDQLVAKTGEILSRVVERNMPRYALVHNHPSGKGYPSGGRHQFHRAISQCRSFSRYRSRGSRSLGRRSEQLRQYEGASFGRLCNFAKSDLETSRLDREC